MQTSRWEEAAWMFVGATIALLIVAFVTGSPLPVLPAMIATVCALAAAKMADRCYRNRRQVRSR